MSVLRTAPWRRAPLLLRRSPAVLLAAGLILGAAAAATPLFLSSAANAALTRQIEERCPPTTGLQVRTNGALGGPVTAGSVRVGGADVAALGARGRRRVRRELIGYVFQQPGDNLLPYLTAREQLSGGEQQRLAFAAAVIGGPALVVADEPTAELDSEAGERLMQAVLGLRDQGTSLVLSSHDPVVTGAVDGILRLHDGELA